MGLLGTEIIEILKHKKKSGIKKASLCMMGKQNILIEWSSFMSVVRKFGLEYDDSLYEKVRYETSVNAYDFFKMFGFEQVEAVDVSDYEGASIIFDLNAKLLPKELEEKFDYVIDGGTLEHVFSSACALENMSRMVKKGGYIVHQAPLAGWIDHGFYSISPTLFLDYYTANQWDIEQINVEVLLNAQPNKTDVIYSQDCRWFVSYGKLNEYIDAFRNNKPALLFCIAQRKKESKCDVYPIQGMYVEPHKKSVKIDYNKILSFLQSNKGKKIALYGAGHESGLLINFLYLNDMEKCIDIIFDSDVTKAGNSYRGYSIKYPTKKKLEEVDLIFISTTVYSEDIYNFLKRENADMNKVVKISDL